MRPAEARRRIQAAINNALKAQSIEPLLGVKEELVKLTTLFFKEECQLYVEWGLTGTPETHYDTDFDLNTLERISDRWGCYGRSSWLLKCVEVYKG